MKFTTAKALFTERPEPVEWVCEPWLAKEAITVLDGAPKSAGKTTFALAMCKAIVTGGEFLGQPVEQSSVVYLTEESTTSFRAALERAGITDSENFHILRWRETHGVRDRTEEGETISAWQQVVEEAVSYALRVEAALLVIDTFAQFAKLTGDRENSAGEVLTAVRPLQVARDEGLGVLVIRHERKAGGSVGESGRGSSAMTAAVEIILQLKRPEGHHDDTHRRIESLSRFEQTPTELTVALIGGAYQALGDSDAVAVKSAKRGVVTWLEKAVDALPINALRDLTGSTRTTLQAALHQLETEGDYQASW